IVSNQFERTDNSIELHPIFQVGAASIYAGAPVTTGLDYNRLLDLSLLRRRLSFIACYTDVSGADTMETERLFLSLLDVHESGSSQLLRKCSDWMNTAQEAGEDPEDLHAQLEQLCQQHSSMALLSNLNQFLHKVS